jgi:hypothetical protein
LGIPAALCDGGCAGRSVEAAFESRGLPLRGPQLLAASSSSSVSRSIVASRSVHLVLVRVQEALGLGPFGLGLGVVGFGFLGARP